MENAAFAPLTNLQLETSQVETSQENADITALAM